MCPSSLFGIGNLVLKVLVSSWGFINIEWYSATPSQVFVSGRTAIDQPGGWTGPRATTWSASWLLGRSSTFWQGRDNTDFRGADFKKKYVQSFYIDKTWFWLWIEMASTATPNVLVLVTFIYSANVWHQVLSNWRQRLLQASRQNIYKIGPYHKSGMSGSQVAGLSSHSMIWTFLVHNLFGPLQLEKDFASYLNIASLI